MLETLLAAGVVEDTGDRYVVTDAFRGAVDDRAADLAAVDHDPDALELDHGGLLSGLDEEDRGFLVRYAALGDFVADATPGLRVVLTAALDQFGPDPTPVEGAPDAFLPVTGETLGTCLKLFSPSVVYVWREECDPCDGMRAKFDRLLADPPADVGLFAVYGPDAQGLLRERYEVHGAPTTLFVVDGAVDVRLVGEKHPTAIENELSIVRSVDGD